MKYLVSLAVWSKTVPTDINYMFSPLRQYNLECVNLPSTRHFAVPPLTDTQVRTIAPLLSRMTMNISM